MTTLHLYDTLSASKRPFEPARNTVTLYVCGVTPYDTTHLGHAFTFVSFDVLVRYLIRLGYDVRSVQNITDVDDPLFAKARELGIEPQQLAADETDRLVSDMLDLYVLSPDVRPWASHEIEGMIRLVDQLFETGHAYRAGDHVYFSVATYPDYGRLSRLSRDEMISLSRERGGDPDDPRKRDPLDFVLWRPPGEGEPGFPSPWGDGLPGWHLECSTMALKYLDAPIDIHGGGEDLIFPHHESEIAQSVAATQTAPFARFWVHTGMVYMDGEKMSKSLGNMVFARDLIAEHGPDAVRLYISSTHYRERLHYDVGDLETAGQRAARLARAAHVPANGSAATLLDHQPYCHRFFERMSDDLDTPAAIVVLLELAEAIEGGAAAGRDVRQAQEALRELAALLGLSLPVDSLVRLDA